MSWNKTPSQGNSGGYNKSSSWNSKDSKNWGGNSNWNSWKDDGSKNNNNSWGSNRNNKWRGNSGGRSPQGWKRGRNNDRGRNQGGWKKRDWNEGYNRNKSGNYQGSAKSNDNWGYGKDIYGSKDRWRNSSQSNKKSGYSSGYNDGYSKANKYEDKGGYNNYQKDNDGYIINQEADENKWEQPFEDKEKMEKSKANEFFKLTNTRNKKEEKRTVVKKIEEEMFDQLERWDSKGGKKEERKERMEKLEKKQKRILEEQKEGKITKTKKDDNYKMKFQPDLKGTRGVVPFGGTKKELPTTPTKSQGKVYIQREIDHSYYKKTNFKDVSGWYQKKSQVNYEKTRLEVLAPVEYLITKEFIRQSIDHLEKKFGRNEVLHILDCGTGWGHYLKFILKRKRNAKVYITDITDAFLVHSKRSLREAGYEGNIEKSVKLSATNLKDEFNDNTFHLILCLGPLYHLLAEEERLKCTKGCASLLKPGGRCLFAGLNRVSLLRTTLIFTASKNKFFMNHKNWRAFLEDGKMTKELALPIGVGYCHFFEEFKKECMAEGMLDCVNVGGVESFVANNHKFWNLLPEKNKRVFFDFIMQLFDKPEGWGRSDHFLFIGEKKEPSRIHGLVNGNDIISDEDDDDDFFEIESTEIKKEEIIKIEEKKIEEKKKVKKNDFPPLATKQIPKKKEVIIMPKKKEVIIMPKKKEVLIPEKKKEIIQQPKKIEKKVEEPPKKTIQKTQPPKEEKKLLEIDDEDDDDVDIDDLLEEIEVDAEKEVPYDDDEGLDFLNDDDFLLDEDEKDDEIDLIEASTPKKEDLKPENEKDVEEKKEVMTEEKEEKKEKEPEKKETEEVEKKENINLDDEDDDSDFFGDAESDDSDNDEKVEKEFFLSPKADSPQKKVQKKKDNYIAKQSDDLLSDDESSDDLLDDYFS